MNDEIEIVARAILNRTGWPEEDCRVLAQEILSALDQHREGKSAKGRSDADLRRGVVEIGSPMFEGDLPDFPAKP